MVEALTGQDVPVVETGGVTSSTMSQVPLAKGGCLIAAALQQLGGGQLATIERGMRRQRRHTVDMVVGTSQDRGSTRCADGVCTEAVVETHPVLRYSVKIGRLIDAAAVAAHGMRGVVVGHDEQDVGPAILHR